MLKLVSINEAEPSANILTLSDAKDHCFVTSTDADVEGILTTLITVAREYAEARTWRQVVPATYKLFLDDFPPNIIELRKPPVISVDSIKYYDPNDVLQTVSSSDYQVDIDSEPGRIEPDGSWPSADDRLNAVEITFQAGYDASDDYHKLPKKIKQAMLLMINHWFNNRESVVINEGRSIDAMEVPLTANALLDMESAKEFV